MSLHLEQISFGNSINNVSQKTDSLFSTEIAFDSDSEGTTIRQTFEVEKIVLKLRIIRFSGKLALLILEAFL